MVSPKKKSRPRPKPVIQYPPLTTRKWIPPDRRKKAPKKPPQLLYEKPPGIHHPLELSSLLKVWHNFLFVDNGARAILMGSFSHTNKRFRFKSNGKQANCMCMVALAFSKLFDMSIWTPSIIDKCMEVGDTLYTNSINNLEVRNPNKGFLKITEISPNFYLDDNKLTMEVKDEMQVSGKLFPDVDDSPYLKTVIQKFFSKHDGGILATQRKFFAVWTSGGAYYLFDPADHDTAGLRWKGVPGTGYSFVGRFHNTDKLVEILHENVNKNNNDIFTIFPCVLLRMSRITRPAPETFEEVITADAERSKTLEETKAEAEGKPKEKPDLPSARLYPDKKLPPPPPPPPRESEILRELEAERARKQKEDEFEEMNPVVVNIMTQRESQVEAIQAEAGPADMTLLKFQPREVPSSELVKDRPRAGSVTYFKSLIEGTMGILRGRTHQCDPNFSKYLGKQSIPNAFAALTMLRFEKSRRWICRMLKEILEQAEHLYHDSMKLLTGDQVLRPSTMIKKYQMRDKEFAPDVEEFTVVGRLGSLKPDVFDLLPALTEFFRDNETGVIVGPLTLAVWIEDGYYYMFDPNERDRNGLAIVRKVTVGSETRIVDVEPGVACCTWYKNLKDLVDVYMNNIPKSQNREPFYICRVHINDYIGIPDPWCNFEGISQGKWILRGHFSQADRRFPRETRNTQCTANAAMSLVYSQLKAMRDWTRDTVDEVLLSGDSLYISCVEYLKANNKFYDNMLMVDEVQRRFQVEERQINLEIADCLVNGVVDARDDDCEILNLKKGIQEFFKENDTGVLTSRRISVALWKNNGVFYYYDSHGRDEFGYLSPIGTACVLRISDLNELVKMLEANLGPGVESALYNLSRVQVQIWEQTEDGKARPPLKNYTEIDAESAILRATWHLDSPKFGLNSGKQGIPMLIVAFGMHKVYSPGDWDRNVIDEVMVLGDKLYETSLIAIQKPPSEITNDEEDTDDITVDNVIKEFKIGLNKFNLNVGEQVFTGKMLHEFVVGDDSGLVDRGPGDVFFADVSLTTVITNQAPKMLTTVVSETSAKKTSPGPRSTSPESSPTTSSDRNFEKFSEQFTMFMTANVPDDDQREFLLVSPAISLAGWRDEGVYFIFDPKARDPYGQVYGKDEWSQKPPEPSYSDLEVEEEEDASRSLAIAATVSESMEEGGEEEEEEEEQEVPPPRPKHSAHYWESLSEEFGRACIMQFNSLEKLVQFIVEQTPPMQREEIEYKMYTVAVETELMIKNVLDLETTVPEDLYAGDWYNFKEIEHGRWILRGEINQTNQMFPCYNRGKQYLSNSVVALAFAYLYAYKRYNQETINGILRYGDRLLTISRNMRIKELTGNKELNLTKDEVISIIAETTFSINEIYNKFCIQEHMLFMTLTERVIQGDVTAKDVEELFDVKQGLETFFETEKFGVLEAKDTAVAVWKGEKVYYMFDPASRGPNGLEAAQGEACITRYMDLEMMATIFLANLPKLGSNNFYIHKIEFSKDKCCIKVPKPESPPPPEPALCTYTRLFPGKWILRGSLSQNHPKFSREPNSMSAPVAVIALTMTLLHKSQKWTKPIVDEVLFYADELYNDSINNLGYDFNPWNQQISLHLVNRDYKVGKLQANCELRNTDQRGIIDIKDPKILNLRQGMERFFEENTHGVIQTETLTVAIWEDEDLDNVIYMYDPNPRGPTGLHALDGTACVMSFENKKLAADHFIANIADDQKRREFVIVPVEIVVGEMKTKRAKKKSPCKRPQSSIPCPTLTPKKASACNKDSKRNVCADVNKPQIAGTTVGVTDKFAKFEATRGYQSKFESPEPQTPVRGGVCPLKTPKAPKRKIKSRKVELDIMGATYQSPTEAEKKKIMAMATAEYNFKLGMKLAKLGRIGFLDLPSGDKLLRGMKSQTSRGYSVFSRGNQDIPNCLCFLVIFKLTPIATWTHKHIDLILDSGDQLYKDSYITYQPKDPKLGLQNVLRKFYIREVEVYLEIYEPSVSGLLVEDNLEAALVSFFYQENFCMLTSHNQWIAIYFKKGYYYVFDPHDRDLNGNRVEPGTPYGNACVIRFDELRSVARKYINNVVLCPSESIKQFTLALAAIKTIKKSGKAMSAKG